MPSRTNRGLAIGGLLGPSEGGLGRSLVATADSESQLAVSWSAVPGATG